MTAMSDIDSARAAWAVRIVGALRQSVEAILEAGRLLTEAKAALPHGAFTAMIETDLPFGARTAQRLMVIAADPRLADPTHVSLLPPHWGTLYELTKLTDDAVRRRSSIDRKNPPGNGAAGFNRRRQARERRAEREAELGAFQAALPDKRYGVVYADPAWQIDVWSPDTANAVPENHYPTMAVEEIKALDVERMAADDCGSVPVGDRAASTFKRSMSWKRGASTTNPTLSGPRTGSAPAIGIATSTSFCSSGSEATRPRPRPGTQWPSLIEAPVREHSRKPDVFYEMIEAYFPNLPKIELFARRARPGWVCWGNEAPAEAAE